MRDITIDIAEEVFVINLPDFVSPAPVVEVVSGEPYSPVLDKDVAMQPGVTVVTDENEILLARQAAMEAMRK